MCWTTAYMSPKIRTFSFHLHMQQARVLFTQVITELGQTNSTTYLCKINQLFCKKSNLLSKHMLYHICQLKCWKTRTRYDFEVTIPWFFSEKCWWTVWCDCPESAPSCLNDFPRESQKFHKFTPEQPSGNVYTISVNSNIYMPSPDALSSKCVTMLHQ